MLGMGGDDAMTRTDPALRALTPKRTHSKEYNRGWADGQASALDACNQVIEALQTRLAAAEAAPLPETMTYDEIAAAARDNAARLLGTKPLDKDTLLMESALRDKARDVTGRAAAEAAPLDVERLADAMLNESDRQDIEGPSYPKGWRGRAERLAAEYERLGSF